MRRATILAGAAASLVFSLLPGAYAQGTNATCLSDFDWMFNSRGQSPCLMAAYLNTPCLSDPTSAYVFALPPTYHYRPPIPATATPCQCSSVFYALLEGCAVCQGNPTTPWSTWGINCTSAIYERVYPKDIPSGTSVPAWAYLDVHTPDNFNATDARAIANSGAGESSAPSGASSTAASVPSSTSGSSTSGGSKSNTGAIVGGVIAAVVGVALIGGIIAWFVIRNKRKNRNAPSAQYDPSPFADKPTNVMNGNMGYVPPTAGFTPPPQPFSPGPPPSTGKVYDPNDPTTFPLTAPEASLSPSMYSSVPMSVTPAPYRQPGQYSGAPEL
ncbi:hypothetical protein NLI96_g6136 [Meripilus lineatus]|uniref:Transmembrane protein n=1 Tax=Meripilus lineatus TaxID=2056292 RepID=A0AAD5YIE2_9APHY|nr:hypothetical protein NLI96_g6136 [Physisporinus lineatus]